MGRADFQAPRWTSGYPTAWLVTEQICSISLTHKNNLLVSEGRGNCTWHRNPKPCTIPQDKENIFHTIFAFFTKSGRKVLDCDRPGRACLTISCSLSSQAKEEATSIDVQMLLNTEILQRDSSSVIQFVTRGHVQLDDRAVEVSTGLPEDISMGFFRRHYREIIEAEKNRKDSDESWDWVQKSQ
ncbi:hypothetical protein cypCar_00023282 [Cyprinus carpio]|nr:hypothetical protein cypCar_00023282 [Cyprinus carpio]